MSQGLESKEKQQLQSFPHTPQLFHGWPLHVFLLRPLIRISFSQLTSHGPYTLAIDAS